MQICSGVKQGHRLPCEHIANLDHSHRRTIVINVKTRLENLCRTWGQTATASKSEHTSLTRSVSQNEGDEMAGKHHATLRAGDVLCCDHAQDTDMCKCILNDTHATFAAYLQLTCKWRRAQVMLQSLHKWTLSCIELNVQCTKFARDKRGHPWRWLNPWAMTHIRRNTFSIRVINYWNISYHPQ